jgi:hypothetical protein
MSDAIHNVSVFRRGQRTFARRATAGAAALCLALAAGGAPGLEIQDRLSPRNAERARRGATQFIVLHTTEAAAGSALQKLRRYGECHYFVDIAGRAYRVIDHRRVAYHSGRSMWNGRTNLDEVSVGIEIEGYHNRPISAAQYGAVRSLIDEMQRIYGVPDDRVLPHAMVAYGEPNRWHPRSHRGRKRCGMQFAQRAVRARLGLAAQPARDPDVRAGRLVEADPYLAQVLFGATGQQEAALAHFSSPESGVIARGRSAWDIARDRYKSPDTTYIFPDGRRLRGHEIKDWTAIPAGTRVVCDQTDGEGADDALKTVGRDGAVREIAGDERHSPTTFYLKPDGAVVRGDLVTPAALAALPAGVVVLVGYADAGTVSAKRSAFDICGVRWKAPTTVYRFPDGRLVAGNSVSETSIPVGTRLFLLN